MHKITRLQDYLRGLELDELEALLLEVNLTILDKQKPTETEITQYFEVLTKAAHSPVLRTNGNTARAGDSTIRAELRRIGQHPYKKTAEKRLDEKLARTLRKLQREHAK